MVEAVISFAFAGIFLAAAGGFFLQSISRHAQMSAWSSMLSVSEIIFDQIGGEIRGAKYSGYGENGLQIVSEGSSRCPAVILTDRQGRRVEITRTKEEGHPYLLFWYYPTKEEPEGNLWTFDPKLYQGCVIDQLEFTLLTGQESYPENVIQITLTLRHEKTGFQYTRNRCVPCGPFYSTFPILFNGQ